MLVVGSVVFRTVGKDFMPMLTRNNEPSVYDAIRALAETPGCSSAHIVQALTREIDARDPRLRGHGIRTSHYALALGEAYGLSPGKLRDLAYAGLLHDIGRLTLPDAILHKDGPLTAEEYALVQCHPRAGAEMLAPFAFLQRAALWIAHHHERWDGCGYPYGLRGIFIPLGSRILAVADTFDVLVGERRDDLGLASQSALRRLQVTAGSQLDPDLVNSFAARVRDQGIDRHTNVTQDKATEVIGA